MSVVICLLLFIEVKRKRYVIKVIVKVIDGIVTSTDFFVIVIDIFTTKRVGTLDSFIMESRAMRDSEKLIVGLFLFFIYIQAKLPIPLQTSACNSPLNLWHLLSIFSFIVDHKIISLVSLMSLLNIKSIAILIKIILRIALNQRVIFLFILFDYIVFILILLIILDIIINFKNILIRRKYVVFTFSDYASRRYKWLKTCWILKEESFLHLSIRIATFIIILFCSTRKVNWNLINVLSIWSSLLFQIEINLILLGLHHAHFCEAFHWYFWTFAESIYIHFVIWSSSVIQIQQISWLKAMFLLLLLWLNLFNIENRLWQHGLE